MPTIQENGQSPTWRNLYEIASTQSGYFTTKQAQEAGYSPQLLQYYVRKKELERVQYGIYRLVFYPHAEREDLVIHWLSFEQQAVFSHKTALSLYELSDVLPAKIHLTLPTSWEKRRLRIPQVIMLHHADIHKKEIQYVDVVPVTSPIRTILDCIRDSAISGEFLIQSISEAQARGLFSFRQLKETAAQKNIKLPTNILHIFEQGKNDRPKIPNTTKLQTGT